MNFLAIILHKAADFTGSHLNVENMDKLLGDNLLYRGLKYIFLLSPNSSHFVYMFCVFSFFSMSVYCMLSVSPQRTAISINKVCYKHLNYSSYPILHVPPINRFVYLGINMEVCISTPTLLNI